MGLRILLLAGAALALGVAAAQAKDKVKHKEKHIERSHTCVCSMSGPGEGHVMVAPVPAVPAVPAMPPRAMWHMAPPMGEGGPQVFTFRDGDDGEEERVVVIRKGKRFRDSADADGDGKVTRREFMKRAEKHFRERDRNEDGELDESEMGPMPFTMPLLPPPPPAPAPPAPPED